MCGAATDAIEHLADLDAEDDLEEFGRMLDALGASAQGLADTATAASGAAGETWRGPLDAALGNLREAHDLLDDGEPSDAVALEVMAARDVLQHQLSG